MAARGPQNGRRGLERGLPLGFWALPFRNSLSLGEVSNADRADVILESPLTLHTQLNMNAKDPTNNLAIYFCCLSSKINILMGLKMYSGTV